MPRVTTSVPKGCPDCGALHLELYRLKVTCYRCGWSRQLKEETSKFKDRRK